MNKQARQPCLQKLLPNGKVSAIMARAKGVTPLTPGAFKAPTVLKSLVPADGWTWAVPTEN